MPFGITASVTGETGEGRLPELTLTLDSRSTCGETSTLLRSSSPMSQLRSETGFSGSSSASVTFVKIMEPFPEVDSFSVRSIG